MKDFKEGQLCFVFNSDDAGKYDDWSFYRNQFCGACNGNKAVDFVCMDGDCTWLIEVKDYRRERRTKAIDLADELAGKVRDTLAGLVAARFNANNAEERSLARLALRKNRLKVVLHLEQPRGHSRLFPKVVDPAKLMIKLRQKLKAIDPHPYIVDQHSVRPEMNWSVTGVNP